MAQIKPFLIVLVIAALLPPNNSSRKRRLKPGGPSTDPELDRMERGTADSENWTYFGMVPADNRTLALKTDVLPNRLDTSESAPTVREHKILLMSDVDDTLTCPAVPLSKYDPSYFKASLAGSDSCPGMKHGQIYYGVGLLLYLLGTRGGASPEFVIVSANPLGSMERYNYIKEYVEKVSKHCNKKYNTSRAPLALTDVLNGDFKKSFVASAWGTYQRMGEHKLMQMVAKAKKAQAEKIVWLGDTGQGDVCAAVCFLSRDLEDCPLELSEETRKDLGELSTIKKYAFLHYVTDPKNPMLLHCFVAAKKYKNIYFVGLPNSNSRWHYASMIAELCANPEQDLLDCPVIYPLRVNLRDNVDCLPDSELTAYFKDGKAVKTAGTSVDTDHSGDVWRSVHPMRLRSHATHSSFPENTV